MKEECCKWKLVKFAEKIIGKPRLESQLDKIGELLTGVYKRYHNWTEIKSNRTKTEDAIEKTSHCSNMKMILN